MRLLIDARVGWGHGIGRVIANTVPRIAALHPEWSIGVLVGPADVTTAQHRFADQANVAVLNCPIVPFSLAEQIGLERYARGYDLTWFTNYWVPLGWRGRFVATVHDMLHLIPEYFPSSAAKRLLARRTFHKLRRDALAVVFVSRFTQREFTTMIGEPRRAVVAHLGGDHLGFGDPVAPGQRQRRLMVVAASKKHKNFALLIRAWQRADVGPGWTLTVISPGSALRSSVDVEALLGGDPRTEIVRGIPDDALSALYATSAILLMPSLYEGFGLPLLEGMLAGMSCVSANAGAMVEVGQGAMVHFVNGADEAGWTASIEAACAAFDRDDAGLDAVLANNAAQARRLTWDNTAARIAALLGEVQRTT